MGVFGKLFLEVLFYFHGGAVLVFIKILNLFLVVLFFFSKFFCNFVVFL